jgi:sporulation protein YlmC with PRC-barrel domain
MRLIPILTASAFALSTGVATAQVGPTPGGMSSPSAGGGIGGAPGTIQTPQHVPAVDPFTQADVSKISGTAVYGSDGSKVGSVSHVLMNNGKSIDKLVVAQGGVLGMGAHQVALPVDQFRWDQSKEGFTIGKNADELKSMAEWQAPGSNATTTGSGSSMPPSHNAAPSSEPAH